MSDPIPSDLPARLAALLDTLVPPSGDGRLPGAGELGLATALVAEVPEMLPGLTEGLGVLDSRARERGAAGFAELDLEARSELLRRHTEGDPGFLPGLIFHTYSRYYREPRVLEALGLPPRPPHPLGYTLETSDFETLLAPVREGPRRYRLPEDG